jgi:hypothetical protein
MNSQTRKQNLKDVAAEGSKLNKYLQQGEDFERVQLGLATHRKSSRSVLRDWERKWRSASS